MKKFTLNLTLITLLSVIYVQNIPAQQIDVNPSKTSLELVSKNNSEIILVNTIDKIDFSSIQSGDSDYSMLRIGKYSKSDIIGFPSLPTLNKLIEIPYGATPKIEIISMDTYEYNLADNGIKNPIFPCQGPQSKCSENETFKKDKKAYLVNDFLKSRIVDIEPVGTMRAQRLALLKISPIQYNPVKGVIKVYARIKIKVTFENADFATTLQLKKKYYSPFFSGMQQSIINNIAPSARENMTLYPVKYVIVSDPMFESSLQPLVDWKKQKGFNVVEAYTNEIGSTKEAIKTYLQGLYDAGTAEDPAPSFVLFIGDINQMPTYNNGNGVTDRNYVEYTGDLLPEIFYGRMSAETTGQLDAIIEKTLQYEQYTMPDPSYLDEVVMIAGVDSGHGNDWGNGQINYGTENYFNTDHDIISHTYLYPESGNNSAQIRQDISNGVTFANYTAHGSPNGWADPSFLISDIPNLENQDKYGLLVGNCCSTSEYQTTCFAEEIVRAENKGAVGYIGGSNSTYWDEDYYFGVGVGAITENPPSYDETGLGNYDRGFHDHGEAFGEWYTTMDQVIFAGNLAVLEGSPGNAEYYWDIYNLIGDPSLMVYLSNPEPMPVSHNEVITLGQTTFDVVTEPYAYVALNMDEVNYATALADENGNAHLVWDGFATPGNAELVITAQNRQPWIENILVFAPDGPYCIYQSHIIQDDSLGNANAKAEFNEDVFFNVSIKNYGTENANNVNASISSENEYVTIIGANANYDTINVDESASKEYGFHIKLADNVPDQMEIAFDLTVSDENDSVWSSHFTIDSYAPRLTAKDLVVDDNAGGNGNGLLDPGESAVLIFRSKNTGHCIIDNVTASLMAYNQYVSVLSADTIFPDMGLLMPCFASFNVVVADDAPEGIFAEMHYELQGAGYDETTVYYPKISQLIEDWETGDFNKFDWNADGDLPWEIIAQYPYAGFYHAASGDIANNQTSEFKIEYEVMGSDTIRFMKKISSEADYDFLKFYIDNNVMAQWSGSLSWTQESFPVSAGMHTFKWVYEKDYASTAGSDKAWIDNISLPTMMVTTLFAGPDDNSCQSSDYNCQGTATNYDSIWWSTSGSGTFDNINILKPNYSPSQEDIDAKQIQLILNIIDVDGISENDQMTLTFTDIPQYANIPQGPVAIDLHQITSSEYNTQVLDEAASYNWTTYPLWAGTIIGETENIIINWNLDYVGEAYIKVAGVNDCGIGEYSDSLLVVLSNPVGIASSSRDANLMVMPNPNNGNFSIKIESANSSNAQLTLINSMGQEVYTKSVNPDGQIIKLNNINSGVYMLLLKSDNIKMGKKIIIK